MGFILFVFMAGASFSTTLTVQEFYDQKSCLAAKEWVEKNSGNVRQAACLPKQIQ